MSDIDTLSLFDEINQMITERSQEDKDAIKKAFLFAREKHEGQFRVSEEPYIIHPVEVAKILINLKADTHTVIAAFLHDIRPPKYKKCLSKSPSIFPVLTPK